MTIEPGSVYHITNADAKSKDAAIDQSGTDNLSIIGWPSHDGDNQKWHVEERSQGRYTLRNVRTGKYIGLASDHLKDNVPAVAVDFEREWEIKQDDQDPTVFRIFVPGTPFNLDLTNYGSELGNTPVAIWGKWEGRNQCWRFKQL